MSTGNVGMIAGNHKASIELLWPQCRDEGGGTGK